MQFVTHFGHLTGFFELAFRRDAAPALTAEGQYAETERLLCEAYDGRPRIVQEFWGWTAT
jgi:hypothetical protein